MELFRKKKKLIVEVRNISKVLMLMIHKYEA